MTTPVAKSLAKDGVKTKIMNIAQAKTCDTLFVFGRYKSSPSLTIATPTRHLAPTAKSTHPPEFS